jgi:hypothetical protein
MSKVTIYQYQMLNTNLGEPRKARRWGTREAIERLKGSAESPLYVAVGVHSPDVDGE